MATLDMHTYTLSRDLDTGPEMSDITGDLKRCLAESGVDCGVVEVFVTGSTGSVTTIEYEPGVVEDLKRAVAELAPPDRVYAHEMAWHDGNGHSHVQAALLGPSISIPVRDGRMTLGTWQQVVVINHDNGPRTRKIEVTILGG
jgi:secondary thiamine-phosphate synthase enzyme